VISTIGFFLYLAHDVDPLAVAALEAAHLVGVVRQADGVADGEGGQTVDGARMERPALPEAAVAELDADVAALRHPVHRPHLRRSVDRLINEDTEACFPQ